MDMILRVKLQIIFKQAEIAPSINTDAMYILYINAPIKIMSFCHGLKKEHCKNASIECHNFIIFL
jgi:hypothetical protein